MKKLKVSLIIKTSSAVAGCGKNNHNFCGWRYNT